jgi:hypothetical protein
MSTKTPSSSLSSLPYVNMFSALRILLMPSQTVSKSIEQYCIAIEELFMREMTPAKRDSGSERDERTSAWLTRARALYQDKKLEAFPFKPTVSGSYIAWC